MKLSEKIITLRNRDQMSQGDLAEKLNVSRQSVSKWETGASIPDLDKLIAMSELFHVTLDELAKESVEIGSEYKGTFVQTQEPACQKEKLTEDISMQRLEKAGRRILPITTGIVLILWAAILAILFRVGLVASGCFYIACFMFLWGMLLIFCKKNPLRTIVITTAVIIVGYILVCWIDYLARL